jgi:anti-sigma factor RsiW
MSRRIGEDELQAFVDDQLPPARHRAVVAHLGEHPEDRRRVDDYLQQKRDLRAHVEAQSPGPTDALTERLQAELAARLAARRRRLWSPWPQAVAAALLIGVGWLGHMGYERYQDWRLPPAVNGAAQAHLIFADDPVRPVELPASASVELARWFSDHLGERVTIPDLAQLGLNFVGGRLLGTEKGPMAQMLYEDNRGRRLSLYLTPSDGDGGADVQVVQIDGFNAGYWKGDALAFTIVAETPTEQLLVIASEIGR